MINTATDATSNSAAAKIGDNLKRKQTEKRHRKRRIAYAPMEQRRALRTVAAAEYCGVSPSLFRKYRARGPDDPGDSGPAYFRIGPNLVMYELVELDRWLDARKAESVRAA